MRIHGLKHVPFEGLANIESWAKEHGHTIKITNLFYNEKLPSFDDFDCLAVMGGPMSVWEEEAHPWLKDEKRFIAEAIAKKKIVLGVCLGSQLLAEVLGGNVFKNKQPEIGWFPVKINPAIQQHPLFNDLPDEILPLHLHSDTFSLPEGVVALGSSAVTPHQGFVYGDRTVALQFHLEFNPATLQHILNVAGHIFKPTDSVQSAKEVWNLERLAAANQILFGILNKLVKLSS